ncbi:MAG: folate family ECF transporter S component [Ruminococcaceae bacterium]|nr:folate family ECF transporter S component [Oscillospiraceae bacterium]
MQKKRSSTLKALVYSAMLAALSVVMARVFCFATPDGVRWSLDKFPLFLAGMFFGPVMGALTGFVADFIGSLMQFGFNPLLCLPAILYGLCGGLLRRYIQKKTTLIRLGVSYLVPIVVGSILYQSSMLAFLYFDGVYAEGLVYYLSTRSIQFAIMLVAETLIIYTLMKTGIFTRLGVWPPKKAKSKIKITSPETAIEYIHSVFWKGSVPGLSRTNTLLAKMGDPHKQLKYVHIAGTNGKGSTAAMTASILQKAGYRVGLYTSPYIYRFHERMQVNGEMISDEELVEITKWVKPFADSMEDSPTEFELVSCIAFEFFKRQKCDIVVLEVGMGGLLDSTNVIPCPEVAVITNIGLDHTDVLGNTLEEIAMNKAGIMKENGHAVIYRGTPGVEAVFEDTCREKNIQLKKANFDGLTLKSHDLCEQVFDCGDYKDIHLPLLGDHQLHNAAVVLAVAESLQEIGWNITKENIYDGIRDVSWPGRFDIVCRDPLFIIDGGHNPQCLEALVKNIQDYLQGRRIIALTGVLADKDYGDMYKPVMPYIEQFVCVTPPNPRRLMAEELSSHLQNAGAKATPCQSIAEGVKQAVALAGTDGVVLCFGSLYTIGDIRNALLEEKSL